MDRFITGGAKKEVSPIVSQEPLLLVTLNQRELGKGSSGEGKPDLGEQVLG